YLTPPHHPNPPLFPSTTLSRSRSLLEMREMRALHPLLSHPDIASVEGDVVAGSAGAEDDHPASLDDQARYRKRLLTGMVVFCARSEEHTSELQSLTNLVCRLLL